MKIKLMRFNLFVFIILLFGIIRFDVFAEEENYKKVYVKAYEKLADNNSSSIAKNSVYIDAGAEVVVYKKDGCDSTKCKIYMSHPETQYASRESYYIGTVSRTNFVTDSRYVVKTGRIDDQRKMNNTISRLEGKQYSCGETVNVAFCDGQQKTNKCYLKNKTYSFLIDSVVTRMSLTDKNNNNIACNGTTSSTSTKPSTNTSTSSGGKTNIESKNAARWLVSAYGGLSCGTPIYIHQCYNVDGVKKCDYSHISNTNKVLGQINASMLTDNINVAGCTNKGPRYPIVNGVLDSGQKYECGEELYITSCVGTTCYIGGIDKNISSKYYGTIDSTYLKKDVENTYTPCAKLAEKNNQGVDQNEEIEEDPIIEEDEVIDDDVNTDNQDDVNMDDNTTDENETNNDNVDNSGSDDTTEKEDSIASVPNNNADIKKCSNTKKTDQKAAAIFDFCYNKNEVSDIKALESKIKEYYVCDTKNGYNFDSTYFYPLDGGGCDSKTGNCTRPFAVRCSKDVGKVKPTMSVSSGVVDHTGMGVITVRAKAIQGDIVGYYYSEKKATPTHIDVGWKQTDSGNFTIKHSAGTIYVWVKDSYGNISNSITATVYDTTNSNTTVKQLQIRDNNGKNINPSSSVSYNDNGSIHSNKYVMMSNNLNKDSKVLASGFNPYDMEYEMEVDSPTVTVFATLTSTDSKYVDGYAPRTVNLDYGLNTVLIKIQDKEGKIRTYTILVTRVDNRNSDNTLKEITLSEGEITFNANVTDYKIEIDKNTKSVDVKSVITSDKASYVSGYEPGVVNITGDTTVKLIKVKSQTGSTRTYVLTFIKKGTDVITEESLMLENLAIPGVYVPFEESVANYNISVDYEKSYIDIKTSLKDGESSITFRSKRKSQEKFVEGSTSGVILDVGENFLEIEVKNKEGKTSTYRFTIIRKEVGLGISNDNTLKDLKVFGYEINFKPEKREYVVKIKQEKTLVITAVPNSNRAEVFIRGNEELTGYSTVRVKVVAENGEYETYSIDIKKDPFNKTIEILAIVVGAIVVIGGSVVLVVKRKSKSNKEYFDE